MEACWQILLARLNSYRTEPAEARREAQALWSNLRWPGDIDGFHTLLRRAVTAMRRVHYPKPDDEIVIRYLELTPTEKAKQLEDPLRRPKNGWTYETLMTASKELFSIDKAYENLGADGLPRAGRQRAAWANDRKMMQTPLGLRAPPKAGGPYFSTGPGDQGVCSRCGGSGHKHAQCPNHNSKKESEWNKRPEAARAKPCNKCKGKGHWGHHHNAGHAQRQIKAEPEPIVQQALTTSKPVCRNRARLGVCTEKG